VRPLLMRVVTETGRPCANVMITNHHPLQSPVRVPYYYHYLKIDRMFNVMRDAMGSCIKCRLAILLGRPDVCC
jgi:hypothetical protein